MSAELSARGLLLPWASPAPRPALRGEGWCRGLLLAVAGLLSVGLLLCRAGGLLLSSPDTLKITNNFKKDPKVKGDPCYFDAFSQKVRGGPQVLKLVL